METLFLWVRLLIFSNRGGDLVLVGKAPFIFQRGGDLVLVGKAPFILFQKRWRPCSCG